MSSSAAEAYSALNDDHAPAALSKASGPGPLLSKAECTSGGNAIHTGAVITGPPAAATRKPSQESGVAYLQWSLPGRSSSAQVCLCVPLCPGTRMREDAGMRCEVAREALSARLDGERHAVPAQRVDAHLGSCPDCRAWLIGVAMQTRRLAPPRSATARTWSTRSWRWPVWQRRRRVGAGRTGWFRATGDGH
ncbi:zinc-finger family protein [Mycobacterium xenopi 3993]|nr:zinc-finger family protein [Mycobacterium xenopi 3993]